ncbi:MAG: response regulator [Burkholderiales bacterium]|nr:response regulator transcription factor [Betaproteobacteria bacterium]
MPTPEANQQPAVFVVDDDESTRELFHWLLSSNGIPVQVFRCAQDFLLALRVSRPGCVVLDLRMPDMSGLDLQKHLAARGVDVPIVFVTAEGNVSQAVAAVKAGAVDFIEKPFDYSRILLLVRECLARYGEQRRRLNEQHRVAYRLASLTPREREVLEQVMAGKPSRVIAEDLVISVKTVEVHRAHIMEKLEVKSVAQLVQVALLGHFGAQGNA